MTVFGVTMGALIGLPPSLVEIYSSDIKKVYKGKWCATISWSCFDEYFRIYTPVYYEYNSIHCRTDCF